MLTPKQIGLLRAFAAANVEYVVVGGVAVNANGYQRTTVDLDLFIRPRVENAEAVYAALESIGVPLKSISAGDLLDDEENLRLGPPSDRIDILASIGEMPFDQVWRNRLEIDLEGITVPFISRADLIENKRQTGRHIDLADAEALEYLHHQARNLKPEPQN